MRNKCPGVLIFSLALAAIIAGGCAQRFSGGPARGGLVSQRGVWVNVSDGLLADFSKQGVTPLIKFPYDLTNGAGICGLLADRSLAGVPVIVQGRGVWEQRPGAGYARIDGNTYDAFYENAGPDIDPEARGMCLFSIQGQTTNSTCAIYRGTWSALTTDGAAFGYDVGAVNWADVGMTILAKKHHNGDLVLSHDGGKTWALLGKGESRIMALGLIGANVLIKGVRGSGSAGGLLRSTDAGTNWTKVAEAEFNRPGHVVVFEDAAYLTTTRGVLVSRDAGRSWTLPGAECAGLRGPVMFGKSASHMVVYGDKGFYESKNGGRTWALAVAFGDDPELRAGRFEYGTWCPQDDTFYITHIRGKAFGYQR